MELKSSQGKKYIKLQNKISKKKVYSADLELLSALNVGGSFVVYVLFFAYCGYWLDGKFKTTPWLMALGVISGMFFGLYSAIRLFKKSEEKREKTSETEGKDV